MSSNTCWRFCAASVDAFSAFSVPDSASIWRFSAAMVLSVVAMPAVSVADSASRASCAAFRSAFKRSSFCPTVSTDAACLADSSTALAEASVAVSPASFCTTASRFMICSISAFATLQANVPCCKPFTLSICRCNSSPNTLGLFPAASISSLIARTRSRTTPSSMPLAPNFFSPCS